MKMSPNVTAALANTFNSMLVRGLSAAEYKQYIEACAALAISTLIKNEGHQFVKDFAEAALNNEGPTAVVQQVKLN